MSMSDDKNIYTLGYSPTATGRMARRTAAGSAGFFLPYLRPGMHVLDCGCGPGSITIGFAEPIAPGEVIGIDIEGSQITVARTLAAQRGLTNVRFDVGNILHLPFPDNTFDAVFGHNILMQFQDPLLVLAEVYRVAKSGAVVGFGEPAWDGTLHEPPKGARQQYYALFRRMLQHNGSDPSVGQRLGALLRRAGFGRITMSASYICSGTPKEKQAAYEELARLCEEVAWMDQAIAFGWISRDGRDALSAALREEGANPDAFFAVAGCEIVGWKADQSMT